MIKFLLILLWELTCFAQIPQYPWLSEANSLNEKTRDIPCLSGYTRVKNDTNSFATWLRNLPLKDKSEEVRLYNNQLKPNQTVHFRIINIDRGHKNLQQCADAVIRLQAEYLYQSKAYDKIHYKFTSGDDAKFTDWIKGLRPQVKNNQVRWISSGISGSDYSAFRKYLETVFIYAGSYSLKKEMSPIIDLNAIKIGDVFIQGGFPGHAVIIVDLCINQSTNEIAVLLAQSYMPAQDIHILKNPNNDKTNPWYIIKHEEKLYTPEWTFEWHDLYRFEK
jgi:hypothetical protein